MPDTPENAGYSIEQLRELVEQLNTDPTQLSDEQLSQARDFIRDQASHLREQDLTPDVVTALTELRDAKNAVSGQQDTRAEASAELNEQRRGLLDDLADPEPANDQPREGDAGDLAGQPEQPAIPEQAATTVEPTSDAPAQGSETPQAVAASGTAPRRAPVGTFKAAAPRPARDTSLLVQGNVTAAGGSPGFAQGQQIHNTAELATAMTEKLRSMASGRSTGGGGDKVYVAHVQHEYPDARTLRVKDWVGNFTKIEQATSPQALTAAGGLCAPLEVLYDVEVIGSSSRPIKNALAPFRVDRGGIQFRPNSSAASALIGGTGTGVDRWNMAQDEVAGPTEEKGCYVVDCPAIQEAEIYAVYLCLEFGNITARFDPETTAAHIREGVIAHARKGENELLRQLQAGSKVLSAAKVIGATRDILANLDKATAYYRNRHRIDTDVSLTCILPAWVRYMMRTDLARQMAAGDWMEALGISDEQIASWFQRRGVMPVWHLDGQIGGVSEVQTVTVTGTPTGGSYTLTFDGETTAAIAFNATAATVQTALEALSNIPVGSLTIAGGPHPGTAITVAFGGRFELTNVPEMTADDALLTGGTTPAVTVTTTTTMSSTGTVNGVSIASQVYAEAAAGAAIPGYPNQVDALLFASGTKLFLDGGSLDLGLVRDSTLNSRNRYRQFSETFEGIADRGVENLRLAMTVQPTGETVGTIAGTGIED